MGSYAVQLAAILGARLTAVARSSAWGYLRDLGVDDLLDRATTPADAGEGYDVVLDTTGVWSAAATRPILEPEAGVLVSVRPLAADALVGAVARRLPRRVADVVAPSRCRVSAVMTAARSQDLTRLATLVDQGRLRVPLDGSYGWEDAARAHAHAEAQVCGKVVLVRP
nr:zinc-binding dehydrogenase [Nocardioides aequoreus]